MISLVFLFPLYFIGIQYERGGWWNLCIPVVIIALILDVILNYTEWVVMLGQLPNKNEFTISKRLKTLRDSYENGWRNKFARFVSRVLDATAPSGKHI